jgi:hypothetical protein
MGKQSRKKGESRARAFARVEAEPVLSTLQEYELRECCDFIMGKSFMRVLVGVDVRASVAALDGGGVAFTFVPSGQ